MVDNFKFIDGIMMKEVYLGILQRILQDSARKLGLAQRHFSQGSLKMIIRKIR